MNAIRSFLFLICGSFVTFSDGQNLKGVIVNSETKELIQYKKVKIGWGLNVIMRM